MVKKFQTKFVIFRLNLFDWIGPALTLVKSIDEDEESNSFKLIPLNVIFFPRSNSIQCFFDTKSLI